jgi:proteic killer suppression protein
MDLGVFSHPSGYYCLTALISDSDTGTVIESFGDKRTAAIFIGKQVKGLPPELQNTMRRKLKMIDAAGSLGTLRVPAGNRLEAFKGKARSVWSIRVNDQWRICFRWNSNNAIDVEITDYH